MSTEFVTHENVTMNDKYVDWHLFDEIPKKKIIITTEGENGETSSYSKYIKHFICEAPVGSGKSTAIREWMINTINENKFILIVPTVNIAIEFYSKISKVIDSSNVKICVKENAFADFRKAIEDFVPIVITTYYTASKCLGGIIESFYTQLKTNVGLYKSKDDKGDYNLNSYQIEQIQNESLEITEKYTLLIDEAHLLLENISIIEMCREFDNVGLISATIQDISGFSVFRGYKVIRPKTAITYDRNIHIYKMDDKMEIQRKNIASNIVGWTKKYDKILIKIEDKKECIALKKDINEILKTYDQPLDHELNTSLYYSDRKEVDISDEGKFVCNGKNNVNIIIATSCIQAGQSLTENMLSVFIQTPLDTVSSVLQFIGRNRNHQSDVHLYLRLTKVSKDKFSYRLENNRYESRLSQLRANTWQSMTVNSWNRCLSQMGKVITDIVSDDNLNSEDNKTKNIESSFNPNEDDLNKEFRGKKQLYKYFNIKSLSFIPKGYMIKTKTLNEKGKRTRVYRLVKIID